MEPFGSIFVYLETAIKGDTNEWMTRKHFIQEMS